MSHRDLHNKKILVAMSGGVDSSVTASLLVDAGYDVTGAYMVNFDSRSSEYSVGEAVDLECWRDDYRDAVRVAASLGIKLLKLDFTNEYQQFVLEYMFQEYEAGRTPNPDVLCNKFVKFGSWLEKAKDLGFDFIATGHYARICRIPYHISGTDGDVMGYGLREAIDKNKDQTYFLHQLNQEQLAHTLFPLGDYTKEEVRALAKKFDLPTAEKSESMGICFVGEVPMKEFLQQRIEHQPGKIIKSGTSKIVGQHDGLTFYTIGQRHGFEQQGGDRPLFVVKKDFDNNTLVVGYEDDPLLYTYTVVVDQMHWVSGQSPTFPLHCTVRLRHRQELQPCTVTANNIVLEKTQKAVTPGQFAVLYEDGECLGGGIIQ